ncbi:MAG TPA: DNA polymerase III subunit delta [Dehalococcoidia bacterium]
MPLYVFHGADDFSRTEALAELRASLDADGMLATNAQTVDAREASPEAVLALCDTVPFLGAYRLVVVEGLLGRFAERRGGRRRNAAPQDGLGPWAALPAYVERMPPSTVLVLVDGEVRPENPMLRALAGKGRVREFRPLRAAEVPEWIRARAAARGLRLEPGAVRLLADLVGNNLWVLSAELEKLALYAGERPVTAEDVRALTAAAREVSVFALTDAVVAGQEREALRALEELLAAGAGGPYLLAMLARQYRLLLLAKELTLAGAPKAEVGRRLGIASPFALDRLLQQASRAGRERLEAAYRRLLEADAGIKRGLWDEESALTLLVSDLAAGAAGRSVTPQS